ncbi:MAG: transcription termination/antitermination NusG family protein [Planctomycetota bacterium]
MPSRVDTIHDLSAAWSVLHVKHRCEKKLAHELDRHSAAYFLPLIPMPRLHGRTRRTVLEPLFPGYMFINGDTEPARRTKHICQVLPVSDQSKLIGQLETLERVLIDADPGSVERFPKMPIGAVCRVRRGKFAGLVGRITEHAGLTRLLLEITILGSAAAICVDAADLEIIDDVALKF